MDTHEHAHEHPGGHTHIHHNTRAVKNRLARIAGHLRAVENMVDEGRDCSEILIQLAAVRAAVRDVGLSQGDRRRHRRDGRRGPAGGREAVA